MSNEKRYYTEILNYILEEFRSTIESQELNLVACGGTDTLLANGIKEVCEENGVYLDGVREYNEKLGNLNIDIFTIILNPTTGDFEVVIYEVKDMGAIGLKEYSQLMGYCLSSYSNYGILINVNKGASRNLTDLLALDPDLCSITRLLNTGAKTVNRFGVFKWNSTVKKLESQRLGSIISFTDLSSEIINLIK